MSVDRDKFLAEAIGGFWHYSVYTGAGNECSCGKWWSECSKKYPDFSTWEGFGKLWEWIEKKTTDCEEYEEWAERFFFSLQIEVLSIGYRIPIIPLKYITPDKFADALYKYLKREHEEKTFY